MRIVKNQKGASAVEYGLLVALIAVAIIVAISALGVNLGEKTNHPEKVMTKEPIPAKQKKARTADGYHLVSVTELYNLGEDFDDGMRLETIGHLVKFNNPPQFMLEEAKGKQIFSLREREFKCCPAVIIFVQPGKPMPAKAGVRGGWGHVKVKREKYTYLNVSEVAPAQ